VLLWILSPLPASVTNDLGYYDGLSGIYSQLMRYGVPYLIGRMYIRTPDDVRMVAKWFVIAGLIAVPFVFWESRMSPQLNRNIYGYEVAKFHMAKRLGGYRPMLFMRHGLEVGLWMATCSAVGLWLWITNPRAVRIFGFSMTAPALIVVFATVISRSFGALILLIGNTSAALFVRATGLRIALIALVLTPSVYLSVRISNVWTPTQMTAIIRGINPDRADSLESRLNQEYFIAEHAMQKPLFGWGGHNRYRPTDDEGETSPVDGWTNITFGKTGLFGLCSLMCVITLPSLLLVLRIRGRALTEEVWAPSIGILLGISIFSLDILFNAFPSPLHLLGIGVIASSAINAKRWQQILRQHQHSQAQLRQDEQEIQSAETQEATLDTKRVS